MEHGKPAKILIVEDEPALRKDMVDFLRYEGFDVFEADNGLTGIDMATKHLPDLIVCDIMMPEADGYEMLSKLQQEPVTAAIPFIFVTARIDKAERRRGMDLGAYDYITKPFSVSELLRSIKKRLESMDNVKQVIEEKNRELRENIILSLPHDLRTPLTTILGFSSLLIEESDEIERADVTKMVQHINRAAIHLYHLIENYLIYAQIEVAAHDPDYHQLLTNSQTLDAKTLIEEQAIRKAQEVDRVSDLVFNVQNIKAVNILDDYLKKLVDELVDNAFKFSEPGTAITVTLRAEHQSAILSIADHGYGMAVEQIQGLGEHMRFDRNLFGQQRSGMGLAIAERIAEIHGGQLQIESILEQHTVVTVRLRSDTV